MSVLGITKRQINRLLRPLGCEIRRLENNQPGAKTAAETQCLSLASELHGVMAELLFPGLPACEGRLELLAQLIQTPVSEAMYLIAMLRQSLNVAGDVCEFGVAQGATSALLANEIRTTTKRLWLFDSFQGFPQPSPQDVLLDDICHSGSMEKYEGVDAFPLDMV